MSEGTHDYEHAMELDVESELLFVVGYPKSGNTWLSRLLGDCLNAPICGLEDERPFAEEGWDRPGRPIVVPTQQLQRVPGNAKVASIVRDPRDICISAMHFWQLPDLMAAVHAVGKGEWPFLYPGGWSRFIRETQTLGAVFVHYANLLAEPREQVLALLESLRIPAPTDEHLQGAIERQSFERRKQVAQEAGDALPWGRKNQVALMRRGIAAGWRDSFGEEHAELAAELFGECLAELGYAEGGRRYPISET